MVDIRQVQAGIFPTRSSSKQVPCLIAFCSNHIKLLNFGFLLVFARLAQKDLDVHCQPSPFNHVNGVGHMV